jgi:hypothetical protein
VIRFSALLVVLAIGLLVAGVVASSLLMVYISIAVCAVAALVLAAGVLWHWSEIFGGGEAQPASSAASGLVQATAPTPVPARPVPAGTASASTGADSPDIRAAEPVDAGYGASGPEVAVPGREADPAARRGRGRGEEADRPASPGPADRPPDRSRRDDRRPGHKEPRGRPSRRPAEPAPPQVEQPPASRPDDLWERVNEELESAGKRDTGALTWPATEFTAIPPAGDEAAPSGGQPSGPASGGGGDWWQPAASRQPPASSEAEPDAGQAGEPAASAGRNGGDREIRESPAGELQFSDLGASDLRAREASAVDEDARAEDAATKDAPAQGTGKGTAAQGTGKDTAAQGSSKEAPAEDSATDTPAQEASAGDTPAKDAAATSAAAAGTAGTTGADEDRAADEAAPAPDGAASEDGTAGDSAPPWTIASWRTGPGPADEQPTAGADEDAAPADEGATSADEAEVDEAAAPGPGEKPNPAEGWLAAGMVKQAAKPQATGQIEVTVVPGVARYHRSRCILIRFLGADDLEVMPRQQAQDAGFVACRACQPDELKTG